ncbi:hypothetical protein [Parasphingopyxis lamellibrachiae]|uniref:hypothetical protein n=1 Tax=Parasphingopyxis lamellibrachiae TaxID=680125 RepID=UPI0011C019DB|nr:hypothetical protein [Parasphingopyxis lamellibrachiae]
MVRILAFFLIIGLLASHGSIGVAATHGPDDHGHDHSTASESDTIGFAAFSEALGKDSRDIDTDDQQSTLGHAHLTADGMNGVSDVGQVFFGPAPQIVAALGYALPSLATAPLLEPPLA